MQRMLQVSGKTRWLAELVIFSEGAHFCMRGAMALYFSGLPFTLLFI